MERRKEGKYFSEWFTIDPPYEKFNDFKVGQYVNGAISPFTAGELAKAAFRNGYEEYGWDIIQRMRKMMERDGGIYFLYSPDNEAPQGRGPSGWGAAGLLSAIDEGLAGIVDCDCLYREIAFSPRFPVTEYTELRYLTGYEVSETFVDLRYIIKPEGMRYDLRSPAQKVNAHILLPKGKTCKMLLVDEVETPFAIRSVGESQYVDVTVPGKACISFEILFE